MEEHDKELIDFDFEWNGVDYDEVPPVVMQAAKKLLDFNLVKVEPKLNEKNQIVIRHPGVCTSDNIIDNIQLGIANNDLFYFTFNTRPKIPIKNICKARAENDEYKHCNFPGCPVLVAGYIYYLEHRKYAIDPVRKYEPKNIEKNLYEKNLNELIGMNFELDLQNFLMPLTIQDIRGLRCAFLGEEGTDKEKVLNRVAKFLFNIGKLSEPKAEEVNFLSLGEKRKKIKLLEDKLYYITGIQEFFDV